MKKIINLFEYKKKRWPVPSFVEDDEPHFLFIITPPFSGSTAIAGILNSSQKTMFIQERGEGQWLIPGLHETDRWDSNKKINYQSIRAVWLNQYQKINRLVQNIDVVIEKSPPNMMRIEALSAQFSNYSFIANNRNPYANCASILNSVHMGEKIPIGKRAALLPKIADGWVTRSQRIQKLIRTLDIPLITYEQFCNDPSILSKIVDLPDGIVDTINPSAKLKIKNYPLQKIKNQNPCQIKYLTDKEIYLLSTVFKKHEKLLDFYNYEIM